jgi:hypothetical protein
LKFLIKIVPGPSSVDTLVIPILISSVMKWPAKEPVPNCIDALWLILRDEDDFVGSYISCVLFPKSTLLLRIQVFAEPVSKRALNLYGGLPRYMSEVNVESWLLSYGIVRVWLKCSHLKLIEE